MPVSVIPDSVIPDSTLACYTQFRYTRFPLAVTNWRKGIEAVAQLLFPDKFPLFMHFRETFKRRLCLLHRVQRGADRHRRYARGRMDGYGKGG